MSGRQETAVPAEAWSVGLHRPAHTVVILMIGN